MILEPAYCLLPRSPSAEDSRPGPFLKPWTNFGSTAYSYGDSFDEHIIFSIRSNIKVTLGIQRILDIKLASAKPALRIFYLLAYKLSTLILSILDGKTPSSPCLRLLSPPLPVPFLGAPLWMICSLYSHISPLTPLYRPSTIANLPVELNKTKSKHLSSHLPTTAPAIPAPAPSQPHLF